MFLGIPKTVKLFRIHSIVVRTAGFSVTPRTMATEPGASGPSATPAVLAE